MAYLEKLFNPTSVAVIGASRTPGKIGYAIVNNIISSGYHGNLYPINPREEEILGKRCYKKVSEVPEVVDLAVLSVPVSLVLEVAKECGRTGIRNLVVITAGFKEVGKEGAALEEELNQIVKEYKMRMLGPNCLGLMDTYTPINASFSANSPLKGEIAFLSQSGALCASILDWSLQKGLGFSKFVSLGNKADLNEADFIADAAEDPYSRVIVGYIESVVEGERFVQVARKASLKKPIILIKSGTSKAGAQAASSHTGALAGSDQAYETAFKQSGILRARSMEELFNLAIAFATQPIPKGDRVAIVTNSGGPGIIATDNVEHQDLKMARFTKETVDNLRKNLPLEANVYNPVDVIGDADERRYAFALNTVLADPGVDSVLVLLTPTATLDPLKVAGVIIDIRKNFPDKPVVTAFMGGTKVVEAAERLSRSNIPCFPFPEPAIGSLAGLVRYNQHRLEAKEEREYSFLGEKRRVADIFREVRDLDRVVLLGSEGAEVLAHYGITVAPTSLAVTPEQAATFAEEVGYPVVLKVASPKILHKTDVGGVKLNLNSSGEVERAFVDILDNVHHYLGNVQICGIEVQKMVPRGRELIIGMKRDVQFGPLLMFGLGGIYVNLLKDVSFRLAQGLTQREIERMIRETKAFTLLKGFRGDAPADVKSVVETIGQVAQLVRDFPEITELDINPLLAYEKGVSALDVKITIAS
ncbi:MAG: acetate--CoA ligase [Firmicutes bacterium]|nr:acetate--CoA ligase [Bacillota bacterium]MCL5038887.1 acetate--CoA ligase [Bacillota bacterium]